MSPAPPPDHEPDDTDLPARRGHPLVVRVVVILALVGLTIPGVLIAVGVASSTAASGCRSAVAYYVPDAAGSDARFELSGPEGPGWQCYAIDSERRGRFLMPLGLIPSPPRLAPGERI